MITRRILELLPTLGAVILLQAPHRIESLHREGAQAVPTSAVREARALNARYRHVLTHQDAHRRILKQHRNRQEGDHGRDLRSFSTQLLEEHLFQPMQPQADDEQEDDGTHDTTKNKITLRQVALEGSARPIFFCRGCTEPTNTQHELESCARCKGFAQSQQEHIVKSVLDLFPEATIVARTQKLMNMIFVEMPISSHDDIAEIDHALSQIAGVIKIMPQEDSTLDADNAVAYMGGGAPLAQKFCGVGGKGVRVAILDSGVDYTHVRIGGAGTKAAYELAYGTGPDSAENKHVNPEVFPTETVIGGRDFLGESFVHTAQSIASDAIPDENPIDANRHGTMVADAILSVAPQAKLYACKVCTSDTGTCPGFSVLQALEYALDPNGDDNMDDKVDIVNLSLGGSYLSSYYDLRTEAMERVFELGVMPVVAAGNEGNIPYIAGPGAKTPNAMSVAATNGWNTGSYSMVAQYSSRGPGDKNTLKPDISAPSGLNLAAFGTGNELYTSVQGTSFAAPVVAGSLALVKERCPSCSPFALKAILMNNAKRHVQYHTADEPMDEITLPKDDAPNSLVGAGEVQLEKALDSDVWAYCVEDTQPSLSFGLVNAHKQQFIKKTIKVINLSGKEQTLRIRNVFSQKNLLEAQENPLMFSFSPEEQVMDAGCNTEVQFEVFLTVDASKAPPNRMTSGGAASSDPVRNDWNEFGGWVIVEDVNTNKDISLAYHSIIRQASDLKVEGNTVIDNFTGGPTQVDVGLTNHGAGVAQMDAFELLFASDDDPEGGYGAEITPSDFRYVGYRVVQPEGQAGICDYLLEFSFTTWEKQRRLNLEFFQVHIDVDFDNEVDYILFNSGVFTPFTENIGCVVRDKKTGEIKCTGMPPDHSTNTANTIIRACTNDIGFETAPTDQQKLNVYILTATATHLGVTEVTDRASEQFHTIEFPQPWLSAPSYNIYPGETLETLEINGSGGDGTSKPLGLMLVTNSYRDTNNTGAASAESETLILTNGKQNLPMEVTPDDLAFPIAESLQGPECTAWEDVTCAVAASSRSGEGTFSEKSAARIPMAYRMFREDPSGEVLSKGEDDPSFVEAAGGAFHAVLQSSEGEEASTCPEIAVPRSKALRVEPATPGSTPIPVVQTQTSAPTSFATAQYLATATPTATPPNDGTSPTQQSLAPTASGTATTTRIPVVETPRPPENTTAQTIPQSIRPATQPTTAPLPNSTLEGQANPSSAPLLTAQPSTLSPPPSTATPAPSLSSPSSTPQAIASNTTQPPTLVLPVLTPPSWLPPTSGDTSPFPATTPQTPAPSTVNSSSAAQPHAVAQSPAPTPLRSTTRPTGPVATAIDMTTERFSMTVSPIFSLGVSCASPALALGLAAAMSLLALIC